jgi:hypothetical protein
LLPRRPSRLKLKRKLLRLLLQLPSLCRLLRQRQWRLCWKLRLRLLRLLPPLRRVPRPMRPAMDLSRRPAMRQHRFPRRLLQDRLLLLLRLKLLRHLPRPLRRCAVWLCHRPGRVRFIRLRRLRLFRLHRQPTLLVVPAFSGASRSSIAVRSPVRAVSRLARRVAVRVSSLASSRIRGLLDSSRAVPGPSIRPGLVLRLPALVVREHAQDVVRVLDLADLVLGVLALRVVRRRLRAKRRVLHDPPVRRVAVDASSIPRLKKAR